MKNHNLVSIVIPCYNQAQYLEESVQSAVDQTYPNIEIIIVNDGSIDDTTKIASNLQKQYPDKIHILSQQNQGLSAARNNGIEIASGTYIVPLDADDLIHREMIYKCIETLKKKHADIVYSDTKGFGSKDYILNWKEPSENNPLYVTTSNATALYKKEIWKQIGGYKRNMKGGYEDWEFWINAYKHGFKFDHHPEVLFYYRTKDQSMFKETLKHEPYHRAKILLNHAEMYPYKHIQEAIDIISDVEKTAKYYFYTNKKQIINNTNILSEITKYLDNITPGTKQRITIQNNQVYLCDILLFKDLNIKSIQDDIYIFFSSIRYEIPYLYNCHYAWYDGQELKKTEGTVFPFILRTPNDIYELDAYKKYVIHLENIRNKLKNDIVHKNKQINQKDKELENRQNIINHKNKQINQKDKELENRQNIINQKDKELKDKSMLEESIEKICKVSTVTNPIKKIKAYKNMIEIYHKTKSKREI